jgi:hypothetical protein
MIGRPFDNKEFVLLSSLDLSQEFDLVDVNLLMFIVLSGAFNFIKSVTVTDGCSEGFYNVTDLYCYATMEGEGFPICE